MGGGSGGGSDIQFRDPKAEQKTLGQWYPWQIGQFNQFRANDPLLGPATTGALDFWKQLPGMLAQYPGFQNELSGYQGQLGGYQDQLQRLFGQLGTYSGSLGRLVPRVGALGQSFQKFLGAGSALGQAYTGTIAPTLRSGGALTADQLNAAIQGGRVSGQQTGSLHNPSALIQDYVSRKAATDANFNQALAQSQGVLGQQAGASGALQNIFGQQANLIGQRAGIAGQQAGITGQQGGLTQLGAGLTGQKAGLLGQQQALQTGGLNQLLGVGGAATSQFGGLTNPILGYLGNLFQGNLQGSIAQSQINAQQQAAGDAKTGSAVGGGLSAIGSIAAIAL